MYPFTYKLVQLFICYDFSVSYTSSTPKLFGFNLILLYLQTPKSTYYFTEQHNTTVLPKHNVALARTSAITYD